MTSEEFLRRVMRSQKVPIGIRVEAAKRLASNDSDRSEARRFLSEFLSDAFARNDDDELWEALHVADFLHNSEVV